MTNLPLARFDAASTSLPLSSRNWTCIADPLAHILLFSLPRIMLSFFLGVSTGWSLEGIMVDLWLGVVEATSFVVSFRGGAKRWSIEWPSVSMKCIVSESQVSALNMSCAPLC
jgi:hypothetical protein